MKIYANLAGIEVGDGFPVKVMGVINVSPESFYKKSVTARADKVAVRLVSEGADIIDVGARSTAPYVNASISVEEEIRRMVKAVKAVKGITDRPVSVDTVYSAVAEVALKAGADIINDISGLKGDQLMARVVADYDVPLIIAAREEKPGKGEPVERVIAALSRSLEIARQAGVDERKVVVDPAIGFFRSIELPWYRWDCKVISSLSRLRILGRPICIGVSRKSFIGELLKKERPEDRLYGSLASTAIAVYNGVHLVRTHDVAATIDVIRIAEYIRMLNTPR